MKKITSLINEASDKELLLNGINAKQVIDLLQMALAEELNAWYQYIIAAPYLVGPERKHIQDFYMDSAKDELEDHAYWLMERINQLNGTPDKVIRPEMWNQTADHKYIVPTTDVVASLKQNIEAEKGAIETYTMLEAALRDKDIVSHTKIKEILADEQEHLADLQDFLRDIQK